VVWQAVVRATEGSLARVGCFMSQYCPGAGGREGGREGGRVRAEGRKEGGREDDGQVVGESRVL